MRDKLRELEILQAASKGVTSNAARIAELERENEALRAGVDWACNEIRKLEAERDDVVSNGIHLGEYIDKLLDKIKALEQERDRFQSVGKHYDEEIRKCVDAFIPEKLQAGRSAVLHLRDVAKTIAQLPKDENGRTVIPGCKVRHKDIMWKVLKVSEDIGSNVYLSQLSASDPRGRWAHSSECTLVKEADDE